MSNPAKYIHLRVLNPLELNVSPFGGRTVAYTVDTEANVVRYAVAKVNDEDRYERKLGATIAKKHLDEAKAELMGVVTLDEVIRNHRSLRLSPEAIKKLSINDFDWPVINRTVIDSVVTDKRFKVRGANRYLVQ